MNTSANVDRPMLGRWRRAAMGLLALCGLSACADLPLNEPSGRLLGSAATSNASRYEWPVLAQADRDPELLVVLAMSGGGKRSSSFSYGVLKGLRDYEISIGGKRKRLLDELDFISGASGGSFTAAYYTLHRDRIFETYEREFLRRDTNGDIARLILLPWNMVWLFDPFVGTNDEMAKVYDRHMFHGATYADLARKGPPYLIVNATDIAKGTSFGFIQWQFDLICADLGRYPLARAVAASNGFPVLFTPITLKSYAGSCDRPMILKASSEERSIDERQRHLARLMRKYADPAETQYVHLMDGGIADNLAIRGLINSLILLNHDEAIFRAGQLAKVRNILVIVADGQAPFDTARSRERTVSGLKQIFDAVSSTQIDAYNFETLHLARREIEDLAAEIQRMNCRTGARCAKVQVHFAHLSISGIPDEAVRARLQKIPTSLTLADDDVDQLVTWGARLVATSPVLAKLKRDLARSERRATAAAE
nr:patatin-like phospholipase family protein [Nitrosomonas nitrosa]